MKKFEDLGPKDIGIALLTDAICLPPLVGNTIRLILAEDLDVDIMEPKNTNDKVWVIGTVLSFIPVKTIITIKEMIKQKRGE